MKVLTFTSLTLLPSQVISQGFPSTCPSAPQATGNATIGVCPNDFTIIGPPLQPVHESKTPPTGIAVDNDLNIYLTYPRNDGPTPNCITIATSFTDEEPWPSAEIQNCTAGADLSTCFVNAMAVVLDSIGQMWVMDSGIPPGQKSPTPGAAKIMSFNITTRKLIRSYVIPTELYYGNLFANDVRINNTLGKGGFAFIADESAGGSLLAIDLESGQTVKRLFNTTVTRADDKYVGVYNGQLIYGWNGTTRSFLSTGADGIALASGMVYWGVLASRRYYYIPQSVLANFSASDEDVLAAVVFPSQMGSEQAGFTADDKGRVYMTASEHNAIFYVDTLQSQVTDTVNGVPPGGSGLVKPENYVVKTLVRNALIQHADSAAILDGWLYFCTNQLELGPSRQYKNIDARRGPFRSYRVWVGAGPAI